MKKKAFVSDIDDTCLDLMRAVLTLHEMKTGVKYERADILEYSLPKDLAGTLYKYEDWIYLSMPILPKIKNTLKKFKELGYSIILMTARDSKYAEVTEFNLAMNGVEYDEIFFNKNKSLKINRLSEKYSIEYFVDDRLATVNKVKRDTDVRNVILINTYANKNKEVEEGVIRINNLHNIEEPKNEKS